MPLSRTDGTPRCAGGCCAAAATARAPGGGDLDWDNLRFVLAVADAGGLTAAGRTLRVDPATVSRRLDALEHELRAKLFHRTRQGLEPTSAGARLVVHARRMAEEVAAVELGLSAEDKGIGGTVAITATEPIAEGFLAPAIATFRSRHPGIAIEVVTDIRFLDLARREADVALRLARPRQGDLRIRRLGTVGYGLYAAADYLARHGAPDPATGFAGQRLVDWPADYAVIPQTDWLRSVAAGAETAMRSNSATARRAAAAAGVGLALLPCLTADGDPALVRIPWPDVPPLELFLVTHRDVAGIPRVRAVLDHLAEEARRLAGHLAGVRSGPAGAPPHPAGGDR
jgi:DNA-binding transcriptional LysR family regulator